MDRDQLAKSLADIQVNDPKKYKELMSKLIESEKNGNEDAKYIIGKVGEISARDRKGYEGLQEFATVTTGSVPGLLGTYLPRALGSAWNGYSMFDPNSPGIVTKEFQENHPYLSTAANLAAGVASGVGLEMMAGNRGGFNSGKWREDYMNKLKASRALDAAVIDNYNNSKNITVNPTSKQQSGLNFDQLFDNNSFLEKLHDFEKKYGYDISRIGIDQTDKMNERAINLLNRHNTFARGVNILNSNPAERQSLGKITSATDFLEKAATQKGNRDYIWITPEPEYARSYGHDTRTAVVRRKFNLGNNRHEWFKEGDFKLVPFEESWNNIDFDGIAAPWVRNSQSATGQLQTELQSYSNLDFIDWLHNIPWVKFTNNKKLKKGGKFSKRSVIKSVKSSPAEFVKRLTQFMDSIPDWENPESYSTHKLSYANDDNGFIVYPEVQNINGKLVDFTRPPYHSWAGHDSAVERQDTVKMPNEEAAKWFTENYKKYFKGWHK